MNCEEIRDLLEAHALDALESEEQQRVEQHVAQCDACRQLLDEYREALAELPDLLAAVTPQRLPSEVKEQLLQKVEKSAAPPPVEPAQSAAHTERRPWQPRRSRRARRSLWQVATAVFAFLLLLILVWNIQLNVALARERAWRAEVADLVGQQELVLEVVDSDQTERLVLLPPVPPPDASNETIPYGKVFTRADMPHVVAMAARLPRPPQGSAYHLWLSRGDTTELAGAMTVDDDGFGLLIHEAQRDGPTYDAATLTLQPLGTEAPEGEPVLVWPREQ